MAVPFVLCCLRPLLQLLLRHSTLMQQQLLLLPLLSYHQQI